MIENEVTVPTATTSPEAQLPEDTAIAEANTEDMSEATAPEASAPDTDAHEASGTDYEALAREDLEVLRREFVHLGAMQSLAELDNPERYGELRDLGLSPREAYLATAMPKKEKISTYDNRSHLRSSVPKSHGGRVDAMSMAELREARELFAGMSDSEIVRLYKKVNS